MKAEMHQSDLLMLEMCAEAYRRRVIEGDRRPASFRMVIGSGVHKGRAVNLMQKVESKIDLPVSDVTDATRDAIVQEFSENDVTPDEEQEGISKTALSQQGIDLATHLASVDYVEFQKPMRPIACELGIKVELKDYPFDLAGKLDEIDQLDDTEGDAVRDCKTAKRTPSQLVADQSEQLSLYSLLYHAWSGVPCPELSLDYLVPLKTKTNALRLTTYRTAEDQQAVLNRMACAYEATCRGVFVPCNATHWKCSPAYCEYFADCRYTNHRRRPQS